MIARASIAIGLVVAVGVFMFSQGHLGDDLEDARNDSSHAGASGARLSLRQPGSRDQSAAMGVAVEDVSLVDSRALDQLRLHPHDRAVFEEIYSKTMEELIEGMVDRSLLFSQEGGSGGDDSWVIRISASHDFGESDFHRMLDRLGEHFGSEGVEYLVGELVRGGDDDQARFGMYDLEIRSSNNDEFGISEVVGFVDPIWGDGHFREMDGDYEREFFRRVAERVRDAEK